MNQNFIVPGVLLALWSLAFNAHADMKGELNAKAEFEKHCASCHANGGNIVTPAKTLKKGDMQKNGINNWQDIVAKMRTPGTGMTKFEKKDISDTEARAIAEYILTTFK